MSAEILPFAKPKSAPVSSARKQEEPYYFCKRCDQDKFKAYANGWMYCATCGSKMNNIFVSERHDGDHGA